MNEALELDEVCLSKIVLRRNGYGEVYYTVHDNSDGYVFMDQKSVLQLISRSPRIANEIKGTLCCFDVIGGTPIPHSPNIVVDLIEKFGLPQWFNIK